MPEGRHTDLPARHEAELPARVPLARYTSRTPAATAFDGWGTYASQTGIRDLAVDRDTGDVWAATGGGVVCWHAVEPVLSRYGSEHGLPGGDVAAVAVAGGRAWALSGGGTLSFLEGDTWRIRELGDRITCIAADPHGRLWAGGWRGIVALTSPDAAPFVVASADAQPDLIAPRAIAAEDLADVVACSAVGVFRFDADGWRGVAREGSVFALARCGEELWIADAASGLWLYGSAERPWPGGTVHAIAAGADGLWALVGTEIGLATSSTWTRASTAPAGSRALAAGPDALHAGTAHGLWSDSGAGFEPRSTAAAPDAVGAGGASLSNLCRALALDDAGHVWIGTPNGTFVLGPERGQMHHRPADADVRAITPDAGAGGMLVTSSSGLLLAAGGREDALLAVPTVGAARSGDTLWVVGATEIRTLSGGAWRRRPLGGRRVIRAVCATGDGGVWIATSQGIVRLADPDAEFAEFAGEVAAADVCSLAGAAGGRVWLGTDRGLYTGGHDGFTRVQGTEDRMVSALCSEPGGRALWAGTDAGLLEIAEEELAVRRRLSAANSGLPSDRIAALAPDARRGRLWIGTARGVAWWTLAEDQR